MQSKGDGYVSVRWPGGLNQQANFWGDDWQSTREAAVAQADKMRLRKVQSLEKQIAKMRKLAFS